jgi:glycosyltransferase involved in cell wall biosynthesis
MPLVSVVIPTYNRANLISETLESVFKQSLQDFEVIVVDDGSTDNTQAIVTMFPIKYVYQPNQGAPNARNTGIKLARGKYVAVLDSDDCLYTGSLEKRVEMLEKYPEAILAYGQATIIEADGKETNYKYPLWPESGLRDGKQELRQLLYANHIPASTVMIRRCYLDQTGLYNPEFIHGQEDLELWVRLSAKYDLVYIAEPLIKLRLHAHRLTHQINLKQEEINHKAIIDSVFRNPTLQSLLSAERSKVYAHLYYYMAEVAYSQQARASLRAYTVNFIKINPLNLISRSGIKALAMALSTFTPTPIINLQRMLRNRIRGANQSRWQPIP